MGENDCKENKNLLRKMLFEWFGLNISDIPKVLSIMGLNEVHHIKIVEISNSSAILNFFSNNEQYTLQINRGDMINPYPTWCLTCDGVSTYFNVDSSLNVEKLCSFDIDGHLV